MKMRGRVKSIARSTIWLLSALLPLIWIASLWGTCYGSVHVVPDGLQLGAVVGDGLLGFGVNSKGWLPASFIGGRDTPAWPREWLPHIVTSSSMIGVTLPLWIPWVVVLGLCSLMHRDHRREKMRRLNGCCPGCGYSRVGLAPDAPCPECGTLPTPEGTG